MVVKSQDGYIMYRLPDGTMVKGVMIFDQNGDPVVISGGGGGGAVSINQGGQPVSSTNALFVRDVIIQDAVQNNGADTTGGAQMVMAGGQNDAGWAAFMPIGRDSQGKQSNYIPIGGHNGTNGFGWHVNSQGQGKVINDSLGDPEDAVATTDTGIWSIPSLLKKLSQTLTTIQNRIATLGQKTSANSKPVVIASDQSALSVIRKETFYDNGAFQSFSQNTNLLTGANTWFDASGYNLMSITILGDGSANYQLRVLMTNNPNSSDLQGVYPYVSDLIDPSSSPNQNDIYVYSNNNKNFECNISMRYVRVYVVNVPSGNLRVASRMLPNGYSSMKSFIPKGVRISDISTASLDSSVRGFYALLLEGLNDTLVTAGGTRLLGVIISNSSTTDYWLKLYSKNSTSGLSATTPDVQFFCKAGTTTPISFGVGRWFSFGIVFRITKSAINSNTDGVDALDVGKLTINIDRSL
jgi:hypothetical protein